MPSERICTDQIRFESQSDFDAATKPDAKGNKPVTVALEIEKGWYLYANPVNSKLGGIPEDIGSEMRITITAKEKVTSEVKYPAGTAFKEGARAVEKFGTICTKAVSRLKRWCSAQPGERRPSANRGFC